MGRKKLTEEEKAARKAEREAKEALSEKSKEEIEEEKKKVVEKAKELEKKIKIKPVEKVEEVKKPAEEKKEEKISSQLDNIVKCGVHLGTKIITPHMRQYIYRRRADGLAILNTTLIEKKIKEAVDLFVKYNPEDIIIICKREAGWLGLNLLSELTGIRVFTKKYPAGIITNIRLPNFFEPELIVVADPWLDKNALRDAIKINKKIIAISDTNNIVEKADAIIPANNKSNKSLGFIFYTFAKEYMKAKEIDKKLPNIEEFVGEKLEEVSQMRAKKKREEELEEDKKKIEEIVGK